MEILERVRDANAAVSSESQARRDSSEYRLFLKGLPKRGRADQPSIARVAEDGGSHWRSLGDFYEIEIEIEIERSRERERERERERLVSWWKNWRLIESQVTVDALVESSADPRQPLESRREFR